MKKYLFLISSVALLASCSNELMIEESTSSLDQATKGLTFQVTETKGQMNNDGTSFFFAEYDHVNVYANHARTYKSDDIANVDGFAKAYKYKATRSKGNPFLTGVEDKEILEFAKYDSREYANNTSEFVLIYPEKVEMAQSGAPTAKDSITVDKKSYPKFYITGVDNKTQKSGAGKNMNIDSKFMIGKAVKNVDASTASYESVGENLDINLRTPFAMIYYSFKDLVAGKYEFGNLNTISIYPADSAASPVALGSYKAVAKDSVRHLIKDQVYTAQYYYQPTLGELALENSYSLDTVTLNVGEKLTNDNVLMNAFILPAERTSKENYTVTYTFDKVTLTLPVSVSESFEANTTYPIALSIADKFPYILTNEDGTTGLRTLYINSGEVSAISDGDKVNPQIKWASAEGGKVPFAKVGEIIIAGKVDALEADDYKALNKCVNVTKIEIKNSTTEIPDSAIDKLTKLQWMEADSVTYVGEGAFKTKELTVLYLPCVTSYNDKNTFEKLHSLYLNSYKFGVSDEAAPEVFFNDSTKKYMKVVNLSSVESLSPIFGYNRNILFTDYKNLLYIWLNEAGTAISSNEFKGCSNLDAVYGVVDMGDAINTATSAFEDCSSLVNIRVKNTVIPMNAFKNATKLKYVYDAGGKDIVVPTRIGSYAFYKTQIARMDLRKASSIGESAFQGDSKFVGGFDVLKQGVVTLAVKDMVAKNTFDGTSVERFQVLYTTDIEANALNSTELTQVKIIPSLKNLKSTGIGAFVAEEKRSTIDLFVADAETAEKFGVLDKPYRTVKVDPNEWKWED